MASATELAPEVVDREALVKPFPLQDTEGHQAAREVMQLSPLSTRLTAIEPELILPGTEDFFDVRTPPIQAADLRGRQRQAMGGEVCGAVSDDQYLQAPTQPTSLRPVGMPPRGPKRLVVEPAVLLEPTDQVPPIVANPLEQRLRRVPSVEEDRRWTTAQPMTGIAEPFEGESLLRSTALVPEAHPQRDAPGPLGPDEPHE